MNPCASPPVLCTSCELLVVVSPGPLSHTSLSSEPPCLERGNTQFALILSAGLCMEVFLQPLPFLHFPLPPHKAEEHSRSAELRLQVGLEVSLWLLSPRMLNKSPSYIFPYFLIRPIFTSQVSLCPLNLPASLV